MAETDDSAATAPSAAARRMRHHRWRRRQGLRCLIVDLHDSEIDALVRTGLLQAEKRSSASAIREALYAFCLRRDCMRNRSRSATGWLDNHRLEHSGPDASPIVMEQRREIDISKFTEGELDAIEKFLRASSADDSKVGD
jgi:hypothetical protein